MAATITVQKGEDATLQFDFTNADASAYNVTGSTLTFTARKSTTSARVIIKAVTDFGTGGHSDSISLSQADLNLAVPVWMFELALVDSAGKRQTTGLNSFYVTEDDSILSPVTVTMGSNLVATTLQLTRPSGATGPASHGVWWCAPTRVHRPQPRRQGR